MDASQLTAKQKEDTKKAYDKLLEAGSKGLTQKQARKALFFLGQTPSALDVSKKWADLEKADDDTVSLVELERLRCISYDSPDHVLRWAFNKYDSNNDGTIDKEELRKILTTVYDDDEGCFVDDEFVEQVLMIADENNDGVLQIEEFVDMLMERTKVPPAGTGSSGK